MRLTGPATVMSLSAAARQVGEDGSTQSTEASLIRACTTGRLTSAITVILLPRRQQVRCHAAPPHEPTPSVGRARTLQMGPILPLQCLQSVIDKQQRLSSTHSGVLWVGSGVVSQVQPARGLAKHLAVLQRPASRSRRSRGRPPLGQDTGGASSPFG